MAIKTLDLIQFLKNKTVSGSLLERLKVSYRPLICPFDDLLKFIKPGANVLDIGCGAGQFLTLVAEFTEAKRIAGLEILPKLIKQAEALLKPFQNSITLQLQTFDGIHFPDFLAEFDTIFLIDVIHHIQTNQQETFLSNLFAGLKPGTKVILKDINAASRWVYFNKLHDLILSKEIGHELTLAQICNMVTKIGFEILTISEKQMVGYPHYTLVLTK